VPQLRLGIAGAANGWRVSTPAADELTLTNRNDQGVNAGVRQSSVDHGLECGRVIDCNVGDENGSRHHSGDHFLKADS